MDLKFRVVEFVTEGSVAAVPNSWVECKDGKFWCYWPLDRSTVSINKRVENNEIPDKDAWKCHEIEIISSCDDYETARRRAKRAEETSDVSTEMELTKRKPKRNRARYPSSSDDDDIWSEKFDRSQSATQKEAKSTTSSLALPLAPVVAESDYSRSEEFEQSHNAGQTEARATPSHLILPQAPVVEGFSLPSGETLTERRNETLSSVEGYNRMVLMKLEEVIDTQKLHSQMLHSLIKGTSDESFGVVSMHDLLENPLQTLDQVYSFCEKLQESEMLRKKLVYAMTASGGQTVGDSVRRITRKIGTASLWSNFNMKGRKKKCSFEKLPLYNMIIKVCRKLHPDTTERDIDYQLAETLKHYPSRQGGYRFQIRDCTPKEPLETTSTLQERNSEGK